MKLIAEIDPAAARLRVERPADGVAMVVLDEARAMNAIDMATFGGLLEELERIGDDRDVRAVVLTGAGGVFSAGGELADIDRVRHASAAEIEALMHHITHVTALLHALPQTTIAAIDGPAAGGGLSFAAVCDLRLASPRASFLAPFIHMGMVPDCGLTWSLPRLIGAGPALRMMLTGRPVDAAEALRIRLVDELSEDPAAAATALAATIARRPAQAVAATRRLVRQAADADLQQALDREAVAQSVAMTSPEFATILHAWRTTRAVTD